MPNFSFLACLEVVDFGEGSSCCCDGAKTKSNPTVSHQLELVGVVGWSCQLGWVLTKKRLSSISSDEKMFETAAPMYQEAINKSGYDYTLKFDPSASDPPSKRRSRKRHILWFTTTHLLQMWGKSFWPF